MDTILHHVVGRMGLMSIDDEDIEVRPHETLMAFPDVPATMSTVKNGVAHRRTGTKCLVFEPETLGLRPIGFAVSSRSKHENGTYQIAINGDLVVSIKWGRKSTEYDMWAFGKECISINHSKNKYCG